MFVLKIITPVKTLYSAEVQQAILDTEAGTITILDKHMDLLNVLKPGTIEIVNSKNAKQQIFVFGGLMFFDNAKNSLLVLADEAKVPNEELVQEIQQAINLAKQGKQHGLNVSLESLIKAERELRNKLIKR